MMGQGVLAWSLVLTWSLVTTGCKSPAELVDRRDAAPKPASDGDALVVQKQSLAAGRLRYVNAQGQKVSGPDNF